MRTSVPKAVAQAAEQIRGVCTAHGFSHETLSDWVSSDAPNLVPAIEWTMTRGGESPSPKTMRLLVREVKTRLDLTDDDFTADLSGPGAKVAKAARSVFSGSVFVLCLWIVVGAILTANNELAANTSVGVTMTILAVSIIWLALLEAAHIGAVALSTADVSELGATHPRVVALHRFIDTKAKLEHYLAARQVGVVLTVFLISEVTRTPNLEHLPGTAIAIPAAFSIIFGIGAPGALLVLVIGQVLPQIITARRPAQMMNLLPMAMAFHATRFIGALALAEPARWLVAWSKGTEHIRTAKRQRYASTTEDAAGWGITRSGYSIDIGADRTDMVCSTAIRFYDADQTDRPVVLAQCPATPSRMRTEAVLLRGAEELQPTYTEVEQALSGDGVQLAATFSPPVGSFRKGDVLLVDAHLHFDGLLFGDAVLPVVAPTKLSTLRIVLRDPPRPLPPARYELIHDGTAPGARNALEPVVLADGSAAFCVSELYPDPGARMALSWHGGGLTRVEPHARNVFHLQKEA